MATPKQPTEPRTKQVKVMFSDEEYERLREVAFIERKSLASKCREAILKEIRRAWEALIKGTGK